MVAIFQLKNPETGENVDINEIMILDTLKAIKSRNKELYKLWVVKLERLYKKKITEKMFEY